MKNGLFILSSDNVNKSESKTLSFIKEIFSTKFKKIAIFSPLYNEHISSISCFCKDDLQNCFSNQKELRLKTIKKYEEILEKNDFVIIIGDKNKFNTNLAKDINLPILTEYLDDDEAKFDEFKSALDFSYSVADKIYFNKSDKFVSTSILEVKPEIFFDELENAKTNFKTPIKFEYELYKKAKSNLKTVVFPESEDERILKASDILLKKEAVNVILLGEPDEIDKKAKNLKLNLSKATIINPLKSELLDEFVDEFYELRKHKGITLEDAKKIMLDKNYFATMLVLVGKADAMISGAVGTTADTIRPALQLIKTKEGISTVSGAFLICLEDEVLVFGDCAVVPEPTAKELCDIAISLSSTAKSFGIEPKIALLSYSTGESGKGKSVDKVKEALNLAKESLGEDVDGPLQFDAAIDEKVAKKKMPNSKVAGKTNTFVFPDLNSGNITYKAVQRLTGCVAMGPILQGLKKPVNDLSRGASVEDIVNTVLISAIQAGNWYENFSIKLRK